MNLTLRRIIGATAMLAAALIWWYPEPQLIQGELVDWAARYERHYSPSPRIGGATGAARAYIAGSRGPLPLTWFIEEQIADKVYHARQPNWADVFEELQREISDNCGAVLHVPPSRAPFTELSAELRFVEWQNHRGIQHMEYLFLRPESYQNYAIPAAVRYPSRQHAWILLLSVLIVAGWGFTGRAGDDLVASSTAAFGFRISMVCLILFSGLLLWPFVHGTFGTDGSFASLMIGLVLFIAALAGVWLFRKQIKVLRNMIDKGECLAHFTFTDAEWARYVQWAHASHAGHASGMFRVILVIAIMVGVGFMLLMRDAASVWVFGFLMGFMVLLRGFVWMSVEIARRRNLQRGQVYISPQGVYINGSVHTWNHFKSRLESAVYSEDPLPHILLTYSQMQATQNAYFYRHHIEVRVPVPDQHKEKAREVVAELTGGD